MYVYRERKRGRKIEAEREKEREREIHDIRNHQLKPCRVLQYKKSERYMISLPLPTMSVSTSVHMYIHMHMQQDIPTTPTGIICVNLWTLTSRVLTLTSTYAANLRGTQKDISRLNSDRYRLDNTNLMPHQSLSHFVPPRDKNEGNFFKPVGTCPRNGNLVRVACSSFGGVQ